MPRARHVSSSSGTVVVVSSNAETLDGMHQYLSQTGVASSSKSRLHPLAGLAHTVRALVIFPDDFPPREVAAYLSSARTERADLTMVIVTRDPAAYEPLAAASGRAARAIVLPRPAFGWTILDAIRTSLAQNADEDAEKERMTSP